MVSIVTQNKKQVKTLLKFNNALERISHHNRDLLTARDCLHAELEAVCLK